MAGIVDTPHTHCYEGGGRLAGLGWGRGMAAVGMRYSMYGHSRCVCVCGVHFGPRLEKEEEEGEQGASWLD